MGPRKGEQEQGGQGAGEEGRSDVPLLVHNSPVPAGHNVLGQATHQGLMGPGRGLGRGRTGVVVIERISVAPLQAPRQPKVAQLHVPTHMGVGAGEAQVGLLGLRGTTQERVATPR
jgi:hypothetical protein